MCSIFGFQTQNKKLIKVYIEDLLNLSSIRGSDTSEFSIKVNKEYLILKQPVNGKKLLHVIKL